MQDHTPSCMTRRTFTIAGAGGLAVTLCLPQLSRAEAGPTAIELTAYPKKRLGRLSELAEGKPVAFTYPLEEQANFLVKLGAPAQGGVGPERDVVAFSAICPHMGGSLRGRYRHDMQAVGPCPFHFSTFDLRKGGIPVHASATQSLPQVVLELEGDIIHAVGVMGLIYGYRNNLADGTLATGAIPRAPGQGRRSMSG